MSINSIGALIAILTGAGALAAADPIPAATIQPGKPWLDTAGQPIHAHAGGLLNRAGVYYWYGQEKAGRPSGVSVYSSTNLLQWKSLGLALARETLPADVRDGGVCERPKVLYNERTRKYVMWMHLDARRYTYASAGVAVSDTPAGPFAFKESLRPINFDFGAPENDRCRQKELGGTFRDMALFQDDDGQAYVFYASEDNRTMYVVRLNEAYTGPATPVEQGRTWARILVGQSREAPAPFKYRNQYYLITSGCTGWAPNAADYAVADHILGPWQSRGNPCTGPERATTFRAQSTFVIPAPAKPPGSFIFMADRWEEKQLDQSSHIWLPFQIKGGTFTLNWRDSWDLTAFD